jgi:hypothetical protein
VATRSSDWYLAIIGFLETAAAAYWVARRGGGNAEGARINVAARNIDTCLTLPSDTIGYRKQWGGKKATIVPRLAERVIMIAVLLLVAVAAGAACGAARLKVWALIPAAAIYSMITITDGIVTGLGAGTITLTVFIGATFLEFFYLVGCVLFEEQERPAPAPRSLRPEFVRAMQSAIGQELRMRYPLPQDLPPELGDRVAQLTARYG